MWHFKSKLGLGGGGGGGGGGVGLMGGLAAAMGGRRGGGGKPAKEAGGAESLRLGAFSRPQQPADHNVPKAARTMRPPPGGVGMKPPRARPDWGASRAG